MTLANAEYPPPPGSYNPEEALAAHTAEPGGAGMPLPAAPAADPRTPILMPESAPAQTPSRRYDAATLFGAPRVPRPLPPPSDGFSVDFSRHDDRGPDTWQDPRGSNGLALPYARPQPDYPGNPYGYAGSVPGGDPYASYPPRQGANDYYPTYPQDFIAVDPQPAMDSGGAGTAGGWDQRYEPAPPTDQTYLPEGLDMPLFRPAPPAGQ